jgi:hypothetical protein
MKNIQTTFILLTLISLAHSQGTLNPNDAKIEFGALTHQQLVQRIFTGERNMIAGLRETHPVLETYLQSLWPNTKASPIDDAYFLSAVDFKRDPTTPGYSRRGHQTFLFGGSPVSRRVRVNNKTKWELSPDGYLDMMFVDLEDFDADTYDLKYLQHDTWGHTSCLIFSVAPKNPRLGGQFKGQIWVEISTFKITRIEGTFTVTPLSFLKRQLGGKVPLYFSFESVREEVIPGYWLPSYTYFDENRRWQDIYHNGETDFHYRGHTFIWGYKNIDQKAVAEQSDDPDVIMRLEKDKLLASPGLVEQRLNVIAQRILVASDIYVPDIKCRVLLTTPIEIFSIGHTIVLSRGLLNISPDESVIAVLLAREIANLMIDGTPIRSETLFRGSLFHESRMKSFEGLGIYESSQKDAAAWKSGLVLANRAGYSNGIGFTSFLFAQLVQHSKQIPNLVEARFGRNVLDIWKTAPVFETALGSSTVTRPLLLRGKYVIDSWTGGIDARPDVVNRAAALSLAH